MADDMLDILGRGRREAAVVAFIRKHALTDVTHDPPTRVYIGNASRGIDLLVEHDRVFCVQVYLKPRDGYDVFQSPLPLGIEAGLTQAGVHALLGVPQKQGDGYSRYLRDGVKIAFDYDEQSQIGLLCFIAAGAPRTLNS